MWQLECQASSVTASSKVVTFFCMDTRHWSVALSTTLCWNSAQVSTGRGRNSSMSRIGSWYSIHMLVRYAPDAVMCRFKSGMLAGHISGLVNWGVSRRKARLWSERNVLVHWLAERQTRLQQCWVSLVAAPASATRLDSTACRFLLQAQQKWDWYSFDTATETITDLLKQLALMLRFLVASSAIILWVHGGATVTFLDLVCKSTVSVTVRFILK